MLPVFPEEIWNHVLCLAAEIRDFVSIPSPCMNPMGHCLVRLASPRLLYPARVLPNGAEEWKVRCTVSRTIIAASMVSQDFRRLALPYVYSDMTALVPCECRRNGIGAMRAELRAIKCVDTVNLTKSLHIVEHFSRPAVRCGAAWTAYYSGIMVTFSKAVKLQFYGSVDVGVTSDETLFSKLLGYKEVIVPSLYGSIPERLRPMIAPESPLNLSNLKIAIARLTCERENTFFKRWLEVSVQVNILEVYSSVDWHQTDWYGINCGRLSELVLCGDVDPELNLPTLKDFISRHSNLSTILIDIQSVRFCLANDFFQAADTALADSHPVHVSRMLFRRNINTLNSEFECTEITVDYSAYAADAGPFIELLADFFSQVKILHLTFSPESPAMEDTPPLNLTAETFSRFPKLKSLDLAGLSFPSGAHAFFFAQKYFGKDLIPSSSWSVHEKTLYGLRLAYEVACGAPSLNQVNLRYSNGDRLQGLIISRDQMTGAVEHVKLPRETENFQIRWPM